MNFTCDSYQLSEDKPVIMEVPVRITGRAKALPANLPDEVVVDVTKLNIGNKIYVGDIKTDVYAFMHPDNAVIAAVKMSRNAMKAGAASYDDEEETVSPDVPATEEKSEA
ncbi:hypothetical protein FQR65_LT16991 [Abscondita terminalis]|nr:hypothetical protein FQR65_LT16991 [Abscondita terminalis]